MLPETWYANFWYANFIEYYSVMTNISLLVHPMEFMNTILTSLHLLMYDVVSLKKKPTKFLNKWLVFTLQCLYIQCNEESTVLDPNADPTESSALATTSTLNLTNVTYKPDPGGSCQQCSMESSLEIAHCVAHYTSVTISCVFTIEVGVEICDIMKKKKNFKNKRNFF